MRCDLHTHSHFSDGTFSPTELINEAKRCSMAAVALCDHNTVSGLPEFMSAAQESGVIAVPGIEFTCAYKDKEVHMLGLFIDEKQYDRVEKYALRTSESKENSNIRLIEKLKGIGHIIDYEKLKSSVPNGNINRAHIAAELTRKGYTSSVKEAFQTVLSEKNGFYVPPERIMAEDVIKFIRSVNALPVLAHPFMNLTVSELTEFLPMAKHAGLAGMETRYSLFDKADTDNAEELAKYYGLLCSGGSDFHGLNKPDIAIGIGLGDLDVPFDYFLKLKAATKGNI